MNLIFHSNFFFLNLKNKVNIEPKHCRLFLVITLQALKKIQPYRIKNRYVSLSFIILLNVVITNSEYCSNPKMKELGDRKSTILFYGAFSSFAIDKWFIELPLFQKTYPTLKNSWLPAWFQPNVAVNNIFPKIMTLTVIIC